MRFLRRKEIWRRKGGENTRRQRRFECEGGEYMNLSVECRKGRKAQTRYVVCYAVFLTLPSQRARCGTQDSGRVDEERNMTTSRRVIHRTAWHGRLSLPRHLSSTTTTLHSIGDRQLDAAHSAPHKFIATWRLLRPSPTLNACCTQILLQSP